MSEPLDLIPIQARADSAGKCLCGRCVDAFQAVEDRADLLKELKRVQEHLTNAEAERDVANGSWCAKNQSEGRGPCGICNGCLKALLKESLHLPQLAYQAAFGKKGVKEKAILQLTDIEDRIRALTRGES